ncbi:MAG TPA: hypothetical protein EYP59_11780 [Thiotrichaceae bacterium]|nr:hypothetical protein [Thiotrichaceae bacterium]
MKLFNLKKGWGNEFSPPHLRGVTSNRRIGLAIARGIGWATVFTSTVISAELIDCTAYMGTVSIEGQGIKAALVSKYGHMTNYFHLMFISDTDGKVKLGSFPQNMVYPTLTTIPDGGYLSLGMNVGLCNFDDPDIEYDANGLVVQQRPNVLCGV